VKGPQLLEEHVGKLVTSAGAFFPGVRAVFRGHDLHASLKDMGWLELYLFGITGRRFTQQQIDMIQGLWCYTSYPDARLWNNRVAALAGTARSTGTLAIAAALAISEAQIYGGIAEQRSGEFLIRARIRVDAGEDLTGLVRAELKLKRGIAGYGRPLVSADERIAPVMALVRELGLNDGPHLKLAFEVEKILLSGGWRLRMNFVALSAALCADMGMSPREYYFAGMLAFVGGMPPCYLDAADKPESLLFPLPCRMVSYEGNPRRCWTPI
jgi:hypothetical protein